MHKLGKYDILSILVIIYQAKYISIYQSMKVMRDDNGETDEWERV